MKTRRDAMRRLEAQRRPEDHEPVSIPAFQTQVATPGAPSVETSRIDGSLGSAEIGHDGWRRPILQWVAAGAAAVLVIVLGVGIGVVQNQASPTAGTPALLHFKPIARETPMTLLSELARRAGAQPALTASGPYQYVHTSNYNLFIDQATDGDILQTGQRLTTRETWTASDGSGRILLTRPSQPEWVVDSSPSAAFNIPLRSAGSVDQLAEQLRNANQGRTTGQWLTLVRQITFRQVITPPLQQALLTILTTLPDLALDGDVTDRAGRPGVAISAVDRSVSPSERVILVLDSDTGALLDAEQVALDAGDLPINPPATIGYTVWLNTGYTPDTGSRP